MLWDNGKLGLGVQIWDGQCCERTLDELPTDGLRNVKVVVMYICVVLSQYSVLNLVKQ